MGYRFPYRPLPCSPSNGEESLKEKEMGYAALSMCFL